MTVYARVSTPDGVTQHAVVIPSGMTTVFDVPLLNARIELTNNAPEPEAPWLRDALKEAQDTLEAIRVAGGWVDRSDEWGDEWGDE